MSSISEACGGGEGGRPLVPGALRGYRTWRLVGRRSMANLPEGALPLTSVTRRAVRWERALTARCEPADPGSPAPGPSPADADHPAPRSGCVCGIYGWYDPTDTYMTNARIFGVVEASGLVLMGERGFRAQKATVAAVVTRNRRAAELCERAGVPVYRRRRDLLRDYPPDDVGTLLGPPAEPDEDEKAPADANGAAPLLRGFDIFLMCAVWARMAIIAAAFVALPVAPALAAAAVVQAVLIGLVAHRLRR